MKGVWMKRVFLVALAAVTAGVLCGSSLAARQQTACGMVTAAEYATVLGHPAKLSPGEGSSSCNVRSGSAWIIPNLNPYNAAYIKRMLSTTKGLTRVPSLGPVGYVVVGTDGSVTSYAEKGGWFIAFQATRGVTKAQAIRLAAIALGRV
jgi:hypothetical protein